MDDSSIHLIKNIVTGFLVLYLKLDRPETIVNNKYAAHAYESSETDPEIPNTIMRGLHIRSHLPRIEKGQWWLCTIYGQEQSLAKMEKSESLIGRYANKLIGQSRNP